MLLELARKVEIHDPVFNSWVRQLWCVLCGYLLTWVCHIGYSTLPSLVRIPEGICEAHEEYHTKTKPNDYVK
jgi:uncharacterized protein CbrC (UPF0167 family)